MEDNEWLPRVDEPMEEYLKSDRYQQHSTAITFSDFTGQEEDNYKFWSSLTPRQRLELHSMMIKEMYPHEAEDKSLSEFTDIVFTEITE
ncbi:MAG: hypothetical protein IH596_15005 [Bacteroidales bacterium]|nr:hypothetical protein [Bacteroidales bacterium]